MFRIVTFISPSPFQCMYVYKFTLSPVLVCRILGVESRDRIGIRNGSIRTNSTLPYMRLEVMSCEGRGAGRP